MGTVTGRLFNYPNSWSVVEPARTRTYHLMTPNLTYQFLFIFPIRLESLRIPKECFNYPARNHQFHRRFQLGHLIWIFLAALQLNWNQYQMTSWKDLERVPSKYCSLISMPSNPIANHQCPDQLIANPDHYNQNGRIKRTKPVVNGEPSKSPAAQFPTRNSIPAKRVSTEFQDGVPVGVLVPRPRYGADLDL